MKKELILQIVIVVLVCLLVGIGYLAYQNQITGANSSIFSLNNQLSSFQSQNSVLQSQNSALNSQINQLINERDKAKYLKTFSSVEELRSFVSNNAGYNFGSSVYDNSDACVKMMMMAKDQGYWMGLMPKQTVSYYSPPPLLNNTYSNNYNCNNCSNNCNNCSYSRSSVYNNSDYYSNVYRYNNYNVSYSGVINVAIVSGRDLYAIESGTVIYVGSMSAGF